MNTKKCREIQLDLFEYLSGNISLERAKEIEKHINTCQLCKKEYFGVKQIIHIFSEMKVPEVSDDFSLNVMKRIEEYNKKKELGCFNSHALSDKFFIFLFRRRLIGGAVSVLILFVLVAILYQQGLFSGLGKKPIPRGIDVRIPGEGADRPIIIWVEDIPDAFTKLVEFLKLYEGKVIKEYEISSGSIIVVRIAKQKEMLLIEELSKLGKVEMEKTGYRDKVGDIVILFKKSSN